MLSIESPHKAGAAVTDTELVAAFLTSRRAAGLSPKSIRDAYGTPLKVYLLPFLERHGLDATSLTETHLDLLNAELMAGGSKGPLSRESVRSYLRHINVFLKWSAKRGGAPVMAQMPRAVKHEVEVLTREEIEQMETAVPSERDKLIVRLAADTGMRLGELVGIRVDDLRTDGREAHIRVKGKTGERYVPISRKLERRLRFYLGPRRGVLTERVFLSLRRTAGGYEALTAAGAYQAIKAAAWRAGIDKRVYPHLLRHSYLTTAVARGMNAVLLAEVAGVSLAVIAASYSHPSLKDKHGAAMRIWEEDE